MANLSVTVNGLKMPNPFVIGSGPPGTNANVIGKAFDEGWGAVIAKTISLEADESHQRATAVCTGCAAAIARDFWLGKYRADQ